MSDSEPIEFEPRRDGARPRYDTSPGNWTEPRSVTAFNRQELGAIMDLYGRMVAQGEWRDYTLDLTRDKAVFSVFRRTTEFPLYRIEKCPRLARKQGMYGVVTATGLILKRGPDLCRVLAVLDKKVRLVERL
ncbi:MAG: DUF2794 domain-containing protein [Hyphomicrobium sp.]|nr:DUF2794 domain-containing protein [Hyphomicrobium sp.]